MLSFSSSVLCLPFTGDLDGGESIAKLIQHQENFCGPDTPATLLILGGTAMSFHYQLLNRMLRGVPVTMAVGEPVSGKSTAVEAAMSVFGVRKCIGG